MLAEKSVLLPISADAAFALLTQPDRLRRWQTVSARVELRAGGAYRWTVTPGHVAAGTFVEIEPGKRMVFGWGWEGFPDFGPDTSTVTITFEPTTGGTLVHLVHDGLAPEQAASHLEGWTHFFERLERAATTGDAGPDEWAATPADLNQLTSADATLAVLQNVLRGITDTDLSKATPCADFNVEQLADHLLGSITFFGSLAGATVVTGDGPLESRVATAAQQTLEAWTKRGLDGTVQIGPQEMPAAIAVNILSLEFLIHAWDFATASERPIVVSDELTTYVLGLAEQIIAPEARTRGAFADAVEVGPDAHILERLIAFSGRVPA